MFKISNSKLNYNLLAPAGFFAQDFSNRFGDVQEGYISGVIQANQKLKFVPQNLLKLNRAAYEVFRKGHVPVVGVNCALPVIAAAESGAHAYDSIMMPLSLAMAERCDAILRIGGFCPGADEEVERVRRRGGVAYYSVGEIPDGN